MTRCLDAWVPEALVDVPPLKFWGLLTPWLANFEIVVEREVLRVTVSEEKKFQCALGHVTVIDAVASVLRLSFKLG